MKTFESIEQLQLAVFIVRHHTIHDGMLQEQEYHIRAERYFIEPVGNKNGDLMFHFVIGEETVASVFSPHYVCDKRLDEEYDEYPKLG